MRSSQPSCAVVAFWPARQASVLARARGWLLGYLVALVSLIAVAGPGAGGLLIPVLVYGIMLTLMAVLASGLGRRAAVGGALFFISAALMAVNAFSYQIPSAGVLIMATYIPALALLVTGAVRRVGDQA
ncbi:MAG: lysoplasmalogenase family protein [Propioniciclava sp.]